MTRPDETTSLPQLWYLAVCRGCGDGLLEMPFSDLGDRNEWAGRHVAATGHTVVTTQRAR